MMELEDLDGSLLVKNHTRIISSGLCSALMNVRCGCSINQQAEQFGAALAIVRIQEPLAGIDLGKGKIGNHSASPT